MAKETNPSTKSQIRSKDQDFFEKGLQLYAKMQFSEALICFESMTEKESFLMKQFHIGLCLIQMGKFEEGLEAYRKIREIPAEYQGIQFDQFTYKLYINMGSVLHILGRRKKVPEMLVDAKTCYETALQLDETDAKLWNNLGNVQLDLQDYANAEASFKKAIQLDEEFPEAHYSLSLVYEFTQRYELAIEQLTLALKWKPKDKMIITRIVALLFGLKQFAQARSFAQQAVDAHPQDLNANLNMTLILYNLEEYELAYSYYLKVKQIEPDFDAKELRTIFQDLEKRMKK